MRASKLAPVLPFLLLLGTGVGCQLAPAPQMVVRGTSFTVLISGEKHAAEAGEGGQGLVDFYDIGFGGEWAAQSNLVDIQRGEIQFFLSFSDGIPVHLLETDVVTRIFPDPASDIGRKNGAKSSGVKLGLAEVQAVVFVSCAVTADDYFLGARKVERIGGALVPFPADAELPYFESLSVVDPPGTCDAAHEAAYRNPPTVRFPGGSNTATDPGISVQLYPHPKLLIFLPTWMDGAKERPPSAAHLEITVPSNIDVLGVIEEQHYGRSSMIRSNQTGTTVSIDFVNVRLNPNVEQLALVYAPDAALGYTRIDRLHNDPFPSTSNTISSNFTIQAEEYWDSSGVSYAGNAQLGPIR